MQGLHPMRLPSTTPDRATHHPTPGVHVYSPAMYWILLGNPAHVGGAPPWRHPLERAPVCTNDTTPPCKNAYIGMHR